MSTFECPTTNNLQVIGADKYKINSVIEAFLNVFLMFKIFLYSDFICVFK